MKKTIALIRSLLLLSFALLSTAAPVSAHGGEPRLEIGSQTLAPGGVLEIRGVDFEFEETITLTLVGTSVELDAGVMTGDEEGSFLLNLALPGDLAEGTYFIRAATDDHHVDSPTFAIKGLAVQAGEEQRSEEDVLLAPMPTFPPGYSSTPIPPKNSVPETQDPMGASPSAVILITGVIGVGIVLAIILYGIRAGRRQK